MELAIATIIGVIVGGALVSLLYKNKNNSDEIAEALKNRLNEIFPEALDKANKQLITLADQKLKAEKQDIKTDLSNKKSAIEDLVRIIKQELRDTNNRLEANEKDRIGSFKTLTQQIDEINRTNEKLSKTTESLKQVLSNNQLRGQFGEQVADNLLKMAGFVHGIDYVFNKEQKSSETRPDFTIFMPDGTRINVDAKFPYVNLQKMAETDDPEEKKKYLASFTKDVKDKIKQVTSRDYISPEENTVDFVILFIPNEMIFSYIYDKLNEVWTDAMERKVIFAGPFSFTAVLRLIKQAYDNFKYQENIQNIIKYIHTFEQQFDKYNTEFVKIGDRIESLNKQYESVNSTRTRQLLRTIDKIKLEGGDKKISLDTPAEE